MSAAKDVKDDRKYTKDHEWAKTEGNEVVIGITAFAVPARRHHARQHRR
jgi:glycine cleavage system H protein